MRRRTLIGAMVAMSAPAATARIAVERSWYAPAEESPHAATWMAWPHDEGIYDDARYFVDVKRHLARLATAIARFEPVFMASHPADHAEIVSLVGDGVVPVAMPVNDMWARDSGPVFVRNREGEVAAVDFNFNGWGGKQLPRADDERLAERICESLGIQRLTTPLVGEGGGLEYDGEGTLLLTDSCWLNENRNPGANRGAMADELRRLLGVDKVIWLPGVSGRDITDGHIDGSIRFVRPGVIMTSGYPDDATVWGEALRESITILERERDARGRKFHIANIPSALEPRNPSESLFTSYANYYVANGAVFTPRFGDPVADDVAVERLAALYPGRQIVALEVDRIYENGGGIHCVTQQQPAVLP